MIRKAFVMQVKPAFHREYEERHSPIWPEMQRILHEYGVHNYSIFLDVNTSRLFAYVEVEDESKWNMISETDECKRWWKCMSDIMPTNADNSPISLQLHEVFHLD